MWRTRPSRRQSDRKIAGVAGAIARRYDIDPVLVRIALVVAAFYGVGLALYLLAWVALPADPADPPSGVLSRASGALHPVVLVAAVIAAVATAGSVARGNPGVLVGIAVLGALLYLLQVNRGERGLAALPGPPDDPAASTSTATSGATSAVAPPVPVGSLPATTGKGARSRRRSVLTVATIGLALLAGGVTGAVTLAGHGTGGIRLILGVMLAVVALGLVVGAFRHAGRGLIVVAVPLMFLGWATAARPLPTWRGTGELTVAPATLAQLAPNYQRTFGQITLDLRGMDARTPAVPVPTGPAAPSSPSGPPAPARAAPPTPAPNPPPAPTPGPPAATPPATTAPTPPPTEVRTVVRLDAGQATVLLPPDLPVRVHCHADVGDLQCLGTAGHASGPSSDIRVQDPGVGAPPGGPVLDLDVIVGAGDVEVTRG
jgi:phage shock protein PspC (stress-responsive transcriptional regulator)